MESPKNPSMPNTAEDVIKKQLPKISSSMEDLKKSSENIVKILENYSKDMQTFTKGLCKMLNTSLVMAPDTFPIPSFSKRIPKINLASSKSAAESSNKTIANPLPTSVGDPKTLGLKQLEEAQKDEDLNFSRDIVRHFSKEISDTFDDMTTFFGFNFGKYFKDGIVKLFKGQGALGGMLSKVFSPISKGLGKLFSPIKTLFKGKKTDSDKSDERKESFKVKKEELKITEEKIKKLKEEFESSSIGTEKRNLAQENLEMELVKRSKLEEELSFITTELIDLTKKKFQMEIANYEFLKKENIKIVENLENKTNLTKTEQEELQKRKTLVEQYSKLSEDRKNEAEESNFEVKNDGIGNFKFLESPIVKSIDKSIKEGSLDKFIEEIKNLDLDQFEGFEGLEDSEGILNKFLSFFKSSPSESASSASPSESASSASPSESASSTSPVEPDSPASPVEPDSPASPVESLFSEPSSETILKTEESPTTIMKTKEESSEESLDTLVSCRDEIKSGFISILEPLKAIQKHFKQDSDRNEQLEDADTSRMNLLMKLLSKDKGKDNKETFIKSTVNSKGKSGGGGGSFLSNLLGDMLGSMLGTTLGPILAGISTMIAGAVGPALTAALPLIIGGLKIGAIGLAAGALGVAIGNFINSLLPKKVKESIGDGLLAASGGDVEFEEEKKSNKALKNQIDDRRKNEKLKDKVSNLSPILQRRYIDNPGQMRKDMALGVIREGEDGRLELTGKKFRPKKINQTEQKLVDAKVEKTSSSEKLVQAKEDKEFKEELKEKVKFLRPELKEGYLRNPSKLSKDFKIGKLTMSSGRYFEVLMSSTSPNKISEEPSQNFRQSIVPVATNQAMLSNPMFKQASNDNTLISNDQNTTNVINNNTNAPTTIISTNSDGENGPKKFRDSY